MRLRNTKTHFTTLPEGAPPANPAKRFTARLYFFLLFCIAGYLVFYAAMRLLFLESRGQVEVGRYFIHASLGGTIKEFHVQQGDEVREGAVLATITQPAKTSMTLAKDLLKARQDQAETESGLRRLRELREALEAADSGGRDDASMAAGVLPRGVLKAESDLRFQQVALARLESRRKVVADILKERGERAERARLLELTREDTRESEALRRELAELRAQIAGAAREVKVLARFRADLLRAEIEDLRRQEAALADMLGNQRDFLAGLSSEGEAPLASTTERLVAPVAGTVQAVFRMAGELAAPGDALLTLRAPDARVAVHGYFSEDQLTSIQPGKRVTVLFPDHSKDEGVIRGHYSMAAAYREKLKDWYIPVESAVLAEIIPADPASEAAWRKFDRMDVTIRVRR